MRDLNEAHIIELLNLIEFRGGNFIKAVDQFEHYDAENFDNIVTAVFSKELGSAPFRK